MQASWRSLLSRFGIAIASVALLSLTTSCSVSRKATSSHSEQLRTERVETVEKKDSVIVEQRDTLREVLGLAKRQSRATTITIDRNDRGDTLKLVQITDLTRARTDGAASAMAKACFQTLPSRDGGRRSQAATTWWLSE